MCVSVGECECVGVGGCVDRRVECVCVCVSVCECVISRGCLLAQFAALSKCPSHTHNSHRSRS